MDKVVQSNPVAWEQASTKHVLEEYAEPFWRPADGHSAAAWSGRLPNAYALLARP